MVETNRRYMSGAAADAAQIDVGLRKYMLMVYNYLGLGLAISGGTAMAISSLAMGTTADGQRYLTDFGATLFGTPLMWVFMFAPLGILFFISFRFQSISPGTMKVLYWVFVALFGVGLAPVFIVYTGESIARTFFITAASFGALSLYGYTTKRDLTALGAFCIMGLFGLLIAGIVNIFLASSMMQFIIAVAGVLIFAGLTAYDTQNIKNTYYESMGSDMYTKTAVMGAMHLFINFVNLFQFLLMFLGNRE